MRERFVAAAPKHLVHRSCFAMQETKGAENGSEFKAPLPGLATPPHVAAG